MGILTRFKDIMSSNINALLDRAEDPEKMIDQCLRNLNSDLGKVKSETAAVIADEQRAKRKLDECTKEIEKIQRYTVKAVSAGNDSDARLFLEKKQALLVKQAELNQIYDTAHTTSEKMRTMNDKLVKDIAELEERRNTVKAKVNIARMQEHINNMVSNSDCANSSINAFEKMEEKADQTGRWYCDSCGRSEVIDDYKAGEFKPFEEHFHTSAFDGDEVNQYQCNNCGAILLTDKDTTATECSFCGAPIILGDRLSGVLAPSKVIPFAISKKEAETAFKKWCRHGFFMPKGFKQADRIKNLTGMYVPFWLYDVQGHGEVFAHCTRIHRHDEGDFIVTKTHHYDVYRKIDAKYNNIPADASEKMPDNLMDKLEPFDYSGMKNFNTTTQIKKCFHVYKSV